MAVSNCSTKYSSLLIVALEQGENRARKRLGVAVPVVDLLIFRAAFTPVLVLGYESLEGEQEKASDDFITR